MYKIIAIDLDETLFNDQHIVDKGNLEAINKAIDMGVKIVIASGRTPGFLGTILDDLNINNRSDEYCILGNGGVVVDNTNNIITSHSINYNKLIELYNFGISNNLCVQVFTIDKIYLFNADDEERVFLEPYENIVQFVDNDFDLEIFKNKEVIKMLYEKKDMNYLMSLKDKLANICDNSITISFSSDRYLELNAIGVTKGTGLKELANYLNVDIKDTIGIGDNHNDYHLIAESGLGVAVNNAIDELKDIADYITINDNNNNAVAEVINKFILGENNE